MASEQTTLSRPVSSVDPFSHDFLQDPYPHHETLREAGPVVWLERYGNGEFCFDQSVEAYGAWSLARRDLYPRGICQNTLE